MGYNTQRQGIILSTVLALSLAAANAQTLKIETTAGANPEGTTGPTALIQAPEGVAFDKAGNIYFSDTNNHRVRKLDANGVVTTVAGTSVPGYTAAEDTKAATNAKLNFPAGLAVDAAGNLYIADRSNHRIRKVDANGIITTVVGVGGDRYSGDGRLATLAHINNPRGVAFDSNDNMYIADTNNNRIRRVDAKTGIIRTVVGNGIAPSASSLINANGQIFDSFSGTGAPIVAAIPGNGTTTPNSVQLNLPEGVAVDSNDEVFVTDTNNHRVLRLDKTGRLFLAGGGSKTITFESALEGRTFSQTVAIAGNAGDGSAGATVLLNSPRGIAADNAGNVIFTDAGNNRLRLINSARTVLALRGAGLNNPRGIAIDSATGDFIVADTINGRIIRIQSLGASSERVVAGTVRASGNNAVAKDMILNFPTDTEVDSAGSVYVSDTISNVVRKIDANGMSTVVAGGGNSLAAGEGTTGTNIRLNGPAGLALNGSSLYIADRNNHLVWRLDTSSGAIAIVAGSLAAGNLAQAGFRGDGQSATLSLLNQPQAVAVDGNGNLYVAEAGNNRVRRISNGTINTYVGTGGSGYNGDGGLATAATIANVTDMAFDGQNNLYLADTGNHVIRIVTPSGEITTFAGRNQDDNAGDGGQAVLARIESPRGVAVDAMGNVYIAGSRNRVRKVDTTGVITTVSGNGTAGFNGDKAKATDAMMWNPSGLSVDAAGNVYVADTANHRVRKLSPEAVAPAADAPSEE